MTVTPPRLTPSQFLIGLAVLFICAYSQYLFAGLSPILGAFIVYGVSITIVTLFARGTIVRTALNRTLDATEMGLGLFGLFSLAGTVGAYVLVLLLMQFDPGSLEALNRPIPLLHVPPRLAWVMVWVSFLVVGPAEEYLFRGFVYGGLLRIYGTQHWVSLAFVSSILFAAAIFVVFTGNVHAGRPLITDDAGTQGKGKYLVEMGYDYSLDDEDDLNVTKKAPGVELDYGITANTDLTLSSAYQKFRIDNARETMFPDGITDTLLELKWRFYEDKRGLGLAVKPGFLIPTGDSSKGIGSGDYRLGAGKVRPRLYFVGTQELDPFAFHLNLGYMRNENTYDSQVNIWHASFAGELRITRRLRIACNVGIDTNPDKETVTDPVFILGGIAYRLTNNLEISFGIRQGVNSPGYDMTYSSGVSIRF